MKAFLYFIVSVSLGQAATFALAANGDLDPTFGSGGLALTGSSDLYFYEGGPPVIQPDGKILICSGRFSNGASRDDFFVARFNANGTLDTSFSFDGKVTIDFDGSGGDDLCAGSALQQDGRIVVAGTTYASLSSNFAVARLNTDGTLDTSFGGGTGKTMVAFDLGGSNDDRASAVAIQPDGKIVIVGWASNAAFGSEFAIVRLLPDGTRDSAFNLTGRVTIDFYVPSIPNRTDIAKSVAIDSAGRIVVGGYAQAAGAGSNRDFAVARLLPNGQLDANFDADGRATIAFDLGASRTDIADTMLLQHDGRIVLAGTTDTSTSGPPNADMAVARFLPDGSADTAFGIGGKTLVPFDLVANGSDKVSGIAEQGNGKILLAGVAAYDAEGHPKAALVRLNENGDLDNQFGIFGKKILDLGLFMPSSQTLRGVTLQGGNIIAGGSVSVSASGADNFVVRLENDLIFADRFE